jgi:hypothetical protein
VRTRCLGYSFPNAASHSRWLVGQEKAVAIAVHNVSGRRRWSKLSEWLAERTRRQDRKCTMDTHKGHRIWIEQCEAAHAIKARYGVTAAFDYLVGEKLMNFADAAADHPDFARELPWFVSEVRRMFTPEQISVHLAQIEGAQNENGGVVVEDDDVVEEEGIFTEDAAAAGRLRRFMLVKELLTAPTLGTS